MQLFMMSILKKVHVLVIPKGEYIDLDDFNSKASDNEIIAFHKAITHLSFDGYKEKGYRALTNIGRDGGQKFHTYIFIYLQVKTL